MGEGKMLTKVWLDSLKGRDHSDDGRITNIKMYLRKTIGRVWIGLVWLRIGNSIGIL
jgi:hypothetical protein